MFSFGTTLGLDEPALMARSSGGLSSSATLNPICPVPLLTVIVWLAIRETVGGAFIGLTMRVSNAFKLDGTASLIRTVKSNVPETVGVPAKSPLGAKVKPAGNGSDTRVHEYGWTPPFAVN